MTMGSRQRISARKRRAERHHLDALQRHDERYADMEAMRNRHGRDSDQYRQALDDVREAAREVRAARRRFEEAE